MLERACNCNESSTSQTVSLTRSCSLFTLLFALDFLHLITHTGARRRRADQFLRGFARGGARAVHQRFAVGAVHAAARRFAYGAGTGLVNVGRPHKSGLFDVWNMMGNVMCCDVQCDVGVM